MTIMTDFPLARIFIETGTGHGATLEGAVQQPYEHVHSIELDKGLFAEAQAKFKGVDRLTLHRGDSRAILPHIITPDKSTAFWLDAHWSGGNYSEAAPTDECPLMGELREITRPDWDEKPLIMVDDSDFFNGTWWATHADGEPYHRGAWPELWEIEAALPDYEVVDFRGVLICLPPDYGGYVVVAGQVFGQRPPDSGADAK